MKKEIFKLKLEKLRIEYDHCEKLVWNILWILSIAAALIITAVLKDFIDFYIAYLTFLILALALTLAAIPAAIKSDNITKKEIPRLIKEIEKKD